MKPAGSDEVKCYTCRYVTRCFRLDKRLKPDIKQKIAVDGIRGRANSNARKRGASDSICIVQVLGIGGGGGWTNQIPMIPNQQMLSPDRMGAPRRPSKRNPVECTPGLKIFTTTILAASDRIGIVLRQRHTVMVSLHTPFSAFHRILRSTNFP